MKINRSSGVSVHYVNASSATVSLIPDRLRASVVRWNFRSDPDQLGIGSLCGLRRSRAAPALAESQATVSRAGDGPGDAWVEAERCAAAEPTPSASDRSGQARDQLQG